MKLIIAGSRGITDLGTVGEAVILSGWEEEIDEVVSGGARGVDTTALRWAESRSLPTQIFNAEWDRFGMSAGIQRNVIMGDYGDRLVAVWDGRSRGTLHMINYMKSLGKPVFVKVVGL